MNFSSQQVCSPPDLRDKNDSIFFTGKIDQIDPADRPHLFQYLIKSIFYRKEEIGVDIFYLPKGYLPNWGDIRACHAGRADGGGEVPAGRQSYGKVDERPSASSMSLKNRSGWLRGQDSNLQFSGQ